MPKRQPMSGSGQNEKVSARAFLDRCTPESGRSFERGERQLRARKQHMHRSKQRLLFDHLVGAREKHGRYVKSKHLRCLEVDD